MNKLMLAALCLVPFTAQANLDIENIGKIDKADAKLIIGIGSRHLSSRAHKILNESSPSIGFEAWDLQAVYVSKNSWGKKSVYLTYTPDYIINDYLSVSINVGAATGYKCSNIAIKNNEAVTPINCSKSGIVPMVAISVDYKPFASELFLSAGIAPNVVMFSFGYGF